MRDFKNLAVWHKSMTLVISVYEATKLFPPDERYGLTSQMRRCAISIPSNIAEGNMRTTNKDFKQFLAIARGSCAELETQLIIAHTIGYMSDDFHQNINGQLVEVSKMLRSFYSKI